MPSASTKADVKTSQEATDAIGQVLNIVEKKVRNLEKRKGKLDQYRQKNDEGEELNKDQKEAIEKYDAVINNLEFARELQKQFKTINSDTEKQQKKMAKREKLERHSADTRRMAEVLELQLLLEALSTDAAREDFRHGRRGAVTLTDAQLDSLTKLHKLISPSRGQGQSSFGDQLNAASEHLVSFVEGRDKEVAGSTYKEMKEVVHKIHDCQYFENRSKAEDKGDEIDDEKKDEGTEKSAPEADVASSGEDEAAPRVPPAASAVDTPAPSAAPAPVVEEQISLQHPPTLSNVAPAAGAVSAPPLDATAPETVQPLPPQLEPASLGTLPQQPQPVADPTAASIGTTSQNLPGLAPGFQSQDDSFFTTTPFQGQRAFTEIVSSVQGHFNFLQDSHIETSNSPHMDPAVVAAQPMALPSGSEFSAAPGLMAASGGAPERQAASQPEGVQQPQLESSYSAGLDYGASQLSHPTFGSDAAGPAGLSAPPPPPPPHPHVSGLDADLPAAPEVPPQIPLPGQPQAMGAEPPVSISSDNQEKKHYSMNPNAVSFHSMYSQQQQQPPAAATGSQSGEYSQQQQTPQQQHQSQEQQQSHAAAASMDSGTKSYSKYNSDYQGSTSYESSNYGQSGQGSGYGGGYRGRDGPRGGPRGGSGRGGRGGSGASGMSNGYNQRGGGAGRPGGPYQSSRGGYNGGGRGSSRGSSYQSYPPRSDHYGAPPESGVGGGGGYYSNGFAPGSGAAPGYGGKRGGGGGSGAPRGGPLRGGPALGGMGRGGPRGGMRGGRGGYGGQRSGPPQQ